MMEKAILNTRRSKKGKLVVEVDFCNGKNPVTAPKSDSYREDMDGLEVEVQRRDGHIEKICDKDTILFQKAVQPKADQNIRPASSMRHDTGSSRHSANQGVTSKAVGNKQVRDISGSRRGTAAYNFVPLDDVVVSAESAVVNHDVFSGERFHGELECHLTTLSELFVSKGGEDFFSINGQTRIPGSTLRGLIRNMVNIMSYSKMTQVDHQRTLFTRPMADEDGHFRAWYNDQLTSQKRGEKRKSYTANAGYLRFDSRVSKYFIQPAVEHNNAQYRQMEKRDIEEELQGQRLKPYEYYKRPDGSYFVTSGDAPEKKREWVIYGANLSVPAVEVLHQTIENYRQDCKSANPSRKPEINLLDRLTKEKHDFPDGLPVFYKQNDAGVIIAFGHTGLFRVPYEQPISAHIPKAHLDEDHMDLTQRMFGYISPKGELTEGHAHASFIQVSDAHPVSEIIPAPARKVILSGPKPTAFQNYLVQLHTETNGKNHWGFDTWLRGSKMYWHHDFVQQDFSKVKSDNMYTTMKPVQKGTEFTFTVKFSNLSKVEFGALQSAIQLPPGLAHKLGMAKALGLGSIRIESTMKLTDPQERYSKLMDADSWKSGMRPVADSEDIAGVFRATIAKSCQEFGDDPGQDKFWDLYRMRQLRKLLSFEHGQKLQSKGKLQDQGYETRKRKILPIPEDV